MEYALLIYGDEKVWAAGTDAERTEALARHQRFMTMLTERNALRGGEELHYSSDATTVRDSGSGFTVTDGPHAEAAEVLGGFYLIEAADLDEAVEFAKQCPEGVVEIRPVRNNGM